MCYSGTDTIIFTLSSYLNLYVVKWIEMLSSKVVFSPLTNSVKCSGLLFSNLLNASFRLPTNSKPFSTKLYRLLNWNRNPQNVRGIGKKFQWNSFPKFKRENRINSLNFTVLGSSVVKFYSGRYHSYNWNYSYLLSAVFVSACNNNQSDNNSTSENTDDHFSDLEFVCRLTEKTLICKSCHLRIRVDHKLPNVEYCKCYDGRAMETSFGGWKPFIERPSGLVWRKEHESYKGLFAYKSKRFFTVTDKTRLKSEFEQCTGVWKMSRLSTLCEFNLTPTSGKSGILLPLSCWSSKKTLNPTMMSFIGRCSGR